MTASAAAPRRRAGLSPGRIALSLFLILAGVLMLLPVVWVVLQSFELPAEQSSVPPVWFPTQLTLGSYRTLFSTILCVPCVVAFIFLQRRLMGGIGYRGVSR
jgi:ABC-type glycerol-3-phosphate transport system permease component